MFLCIRKEEKKEIKTIAEGVKKTLISRIEIYKKFTTLQRNEKVKSRNKKITFFKIVKKKEIKTSTNTKHKTQNKMFYSDKTLPLYNHSKGIFKSP